MPIQLLSMNPEAAFRFSSLVGRICTFLFFLNLVITFVYVLGSTQEFLDSSQSLILQFFRIVSLAYIFGAIYFISIHTVAMIRSAKVRLTPVVLSLAGIGITVALYFGAEFILALLKEVS